MEELYSNENSIFALGCIFNNPSILDRFAFRKEDFEERFHKILFAVSENLYKLGTKEIDVIAVTQYIDNFPTQKAILVDNEFEEFIITVKETVNTANIELYFNNVRKLTILREYFKMGWDISELYNPEVNDFGVLAKLEMKEILEHFEAKQIRVKKEFEINKNLEKQAGIGFEKIKESFKENPYFGALVPSAYLSTLQRGFCRGHLNLVSAPSGAGKTITSVHELIYLTANELWNEDKKQFEKNLNKTGNGLFINTELDLQTEIEPMLIASISGVERGVIMDGVYNNDEEERVDRAIEILKESDLYLVDMPDFTIAKLELCIKDYVLNYDVHYVVFDYIADNGIVGTEMNTGTVMRGDMVLLNLATSLKTLAHDYHVGIRSGTQLNGNEKHDNVITENCLSGSKAIKNKCDNCLILLKLRPDEHKLAPTIQAKKNSVKECNRIAHVFKSRFSRKDDMIKVWLHVDTGTGRIYDIATTNYDNELIDVEKAVLKQDF